MPRKKGPNPRLVPQTAKYDAATLAVANRLARITNTSLSTVLRRAAEAHLRKHAGPLLRDGLSRQDFDRACDTGR